jgi:hypothetical protein
MANFRDAVRSRHGSLVGRKRTSGETDRLFRFLDNCGRPTKKAPVRARGLFVSMS